MSEVPVGWHGSGGNGSWRWGPGPGPRAEGLNGPAVPVRGGVRGVCLAVELVQQSSDVAALCLPTTWEGTVQSSAASRGSCAGM